MISIFFQSGISAPVFYAINSKGLNKFI